MTKSILIFSLIVILFGCQSEPDSSSSIQNNSVEQQKRNTIDSLLAIANENTPVVVDTMTIDTTIQDTTTMAKKVERPTRKPPKIEFETLKYDYDTIQQGEEVTYSFYFTNTGERPLTISGTEGSCGCTRASYPFVDIAPNERGKIEATFSSKGKEGKQITTVSVYANTTPKVHTLALHGYVEKKAE